ncbi:MAG: hypothetical protein Q4G51_08570 [Dermatophilus congolensis]|nr:hypothetical protein [Dermatophilus congolensis]
MFKALVLDARVNVVPHTIFGGLTLASLLLGFVTEFFVLTWIFPALWLSFTSESHRDLQRLGPVGPLQSVVGVTRRDAVRARYLTVTLVMLVVLAGAALILVFSPEAGTAAAKVLVALAAAVTAIAAIGMTLAYVAPAPTGQIVTIGLAVALSFVGMGPLLLGRADSWSVEALSDFLWAGPLSFATLFVAAALVTLPVGHAIAQRAYANTDL